MTAKRISEKAVKVEDKKLHNYELVLIISPEIMDEALATKMDDVSRLISEKGGVISNVEQWGKRRLSYPIERFTEGNYVVTQFALKPGLSKELEAKLRISEEILRHLLIRIE